MDNAVAMWPGEDRLGDLPDHGPRARRAEKGVTRTGIWKGPPPEKSFINLSSTTALIRRLFALHAVIAAIKINKIHIDPVPTNQEAAGSNPAGRTS
jgi:hypothetical protein